MSEEQVVQPTETPPEPPAQETPPAAETPPEAPPSEAPDGQSAAPPEAPPQEGEPVARAVPKPDEYVLPEGMPEELRQVAHDLDYTQEQLDGSLKEFANYANGMRAVEMNALHEMGQTHIKNWGDSAETNLTLARQALKQNDPDGKMAKVLKTSGYANHPVVLDFLLGIGRSMQEGGFLTTAVKRPPGQKTLAQALFPNHPTKEG